MPGVRRAGVRGQGSGFEGADLVLSDAAFLAGTGEEGSGVAIRYRLFWSECVKSREHKVEAWATRFSPQTR